MDEGEWEMQNNSSWQLVPRSMIMFSVSYPRQSMCHVLLVKRVFALLQIEPRAAAGNTDVEGPITDSLAPFKKVCQAPFMAAGEEQDTRAPGF
jgi:hypothetical protein